MTSKLRIMSLNSNPAESPSWAAWHVKGGTSTAANDELEERRFQEAEARRDQALADKANSVQAPIQPSADMIASSIAQAVSTDKGLMYSCKPTQNPNAPVGHIPVVYENRRGGVITNGLADLIIGTADDPKELVLILFCPRCHATKAHEAESIIQIRQSNRRFEFVQAPDLVTYEDNLVYSLGTIVESEPFKCPHCTWHARFDKNRVREV